MSTSGPPGQPRGASHPGTVCMDPVPPSPSTQRPWHRPGGREGAGTIARLVVSGGHKHAFTSPQDRVCAAWRQREQAQCPAGEDAALATPPAGSRQRLPAACSLGPRAPAEQAAGARPALQGGVPATPHRIPAQEDPGLLGGGPQVPSSTGWGVEPALKVGRALVQSQRGRRMSVLWLLYKTPQTQQLRPARPAT